jgi:hypothetical protein
MNNTRRYKRIAVENWKLEIVRSCNVIASFLLKRIYTGKKQKFYSHFNVIDWRLGSVSNIFRLVATQ